MNRIFERFAGRTAFLSGQPHAFILACLIIIVWAITGPLFRWSDTWQLVINTGTTIVTFLMVFLIQNAQNRDGAAIQCKLDELIRAGAKARNEVIGIEHLTEGQLMALQGMLEELAGNAAEREHSIARLIMRR